MSRAVTVLHNLALGSLNQHHFDDAIRFANRSLAVARAAGLSQAEMASASTLLANALRHKGDLAGAFAAIRRAVQTLETADSLVERQRSLLLFGALWRMGVILGEEDAVSLDRPDEAAAALRRALGLAEGLCQADPRDATSRILVASAARELGAVLCCRDPRAALEVYGQGIRRLREVTNNDKARREEAALLAGSAYPLRRLGRVGEAGERVTEALRLLTATKSLPAARLEPGGPAHAALRAWGDHLAAVGQPERADEVYGELIEKIMASKPDMENDLTHATSLSSVYDARAAILRGLGRAGEADALAARHHELWRHWDRKLPGNVYVRRRLAAAASRARSH